jgi:hypothetical protein
MNYLLGYNPSYRESLQSQRLEIKAKRSENNFKSTKQRE